MSLAGTSAGRALLGPAARTGALLWLIAGTSFLAVLAFAAALALAAEARFLAASGKGKYTIELVGTAPAVQAQRAAHLQAAAARLPGVVRVTPVPATEIDRLIAPMLGEARADFALPTLIDVATDRDDAAAALAALARSVPHAALTPAADGLAPLAALVRACRGLAASVALIAAAISLLAATLAARTMVAAHLTTFGILHALGATDRDMAALVQRQTALEALAGGAAGLVGAGLVLWLLARRYAALGAFAPGRFAPGLVAPLLLLLVPVVLAGAAMLAARLTALTMLARGP